MEEKRKQVLKEAEDIVLKYPRRAEANPRLKQGHLVQLLIKMGRKADVYESTGPRTGRMRLIDDLRTLFWRYHVPVVPVSEPDSDEPRPSEEVPFLVGNKVTVFWPKCECWYQGVVNDVDQTDSTFQVYYQHDDELCWHDLSWEVKLLE